MSRLAARRGSILIVVVGMVGIIAAICLTFLAKARMEAQEIGQFSKVAQARICLAAACAYIMETGRIGWDDPATHLVHEEAFGWVDVRDGQTGPRTVLTRPAVYDGSGRLVASAVYQPVLTSAYSATSADYLSLWPYVRGISRHLMYRMTRPPYAISQDVAPNAIENDPAKPLFGLPLLRKPDPQPATSTTYENFASGDASLVPGTGGRGWFRILRDGPATFVITVGSGATQGFRDWIEVSNQGSAGLFIGGQSEFESLLSEEVRLWFRIEWSPTITVSNPTSKSWDRDGGDWPTHSQTAITVPWTTYANQAGTIQWIQRLRAPPEVW